MSDAGTPGGTHTHTASQVQMSAATSRRRSLIALSLVTTLGACRAHEEREPIQPPGFSFDTPWPKNWMDTDDDGLPDAMIDAQGKLHPFPK